jgi:hypothetical protein
MTKNQKALAAVATIGIIGTGLYFSTRKKKGDNTDYVPPLPDAPSPAPSPNPNQVIPSPTALNHGIVFTKNDKLYVQEMQRKIGVDDDGAWGKITEAALVKKAPGIIRPFSLNNLDNYIKNVAAIGKFKKGQKVWAQKAHTINLTKIATGVTTSRSVKAGQYLGVITEVRKATYVIKNDFGETLISSPLLLASGSMGNAFGRVQQSNSLSLL